MSWRDKVNLNDLFIYCIDWKTKKEICKEYNLTPIEGWHCMKFCKGLWGDFETKTNVGLTHRALAIRTRNSTLKEIGYIK